jgi:hypothetical protein
LVLGSGCLFFFSGLLNLAAFVAALTFLGPGRRQVVLTPEALEEFELADRRTSLPPPRKAAAAPREGGEVDLEAGQIQAALIPVLALAGPERVEAPPGQAPLPAVPEGAEGEWPAGFASDGSRWDPDVCLRIELVWQLGTCDAGWLLASGVRPSHLLSSAPTQRRAAPHPARQPAPPLHVPGGRGVPQAHHHALHPARHDLHQRAVLGASAKGEPAPAREAAPSAAAP